MAFGHQIPRGGKYYDNHPGNGTREDDCGHIVGWYRTVAEAIEETGIRHIHSALYRNGKAGGVNWRKISEDCFKALAAMNDENDRDQWFIDELGHFEKCRVKEANIVGWIMLYGKTPRKATAEEIIEHFKKR